MDDDIVPRIHNTTLRCCFFSTQLQAWAGSEGSRRLRLSDFKVVGLSALRTGRLYPQLSRNQRHNMAGRIKSKKISNYTISHCAYSAVPQPIASSRAPVTALWARGNNGRKITEKMNCQVAVMGETKSTVVTDSV